MDLKDRIVDLCKKNGIPVRKLEEDLKFGGGYIAKLNKSKPNTEKINQIANYFSVSIDYLVNGKEPEFDKYGVQETHLYSQIRNDAELFKALSKYFKLSDAKKKHVVELINLLGE